MNEPHPPYLSSLSQLIRDSVLSLLADNSSLTILKIMDGKEYRIQRIASSLNLPLSSAYRKVNKLGHLKVTKKVKIVHKNDGTDE